MLCGKPTFLARAARLCLVVCGNTRLVRGCPSLPGAGYRRWPGAIAADNTRGDISDLETGLGVFVDLNDCSGHTETEADICVIGAGAAGITIARELAGGQLSVALLESGGIRHEPDIQLLHCGESVGAKYGPLEETRVRYFGGTTNPEGWGGWCKPLDSLDFEERAWVPHSGWPFARETLEPWYWRAQRVCELGPYDYDLERWRARVRKPLGELPLTGARVVTQLAQISPPTRFGRRYGAELDAAENVVVYLHANVTEIVTDRDGSTARSVEAVTLEGRRLSVACRYVVLAAGGIENARLLLLSRRANPAGLGNDHDLVGRFFSDHPALDLGEIEFSERGLPDLYDPYFKFRKRVRTLRGVYDRSLVAGSLNLTPETQIHEGVLNYRAWIAPTFPGQPGARQETAAAAALRRLYLSAREREVPATLRRDLEAVLRRPDHAAWTVFGRLAGRLTRLGRFVRPDRLIEHYRLVNIIEPEQLSESRVMLAETTDPLGVPRVRLDWRVGPLVQTTLATAHEILDEELRDRGIGRLVDPFRLGQEKRFEEALGWVWHHMGTTRMHVDPERGVVDSDCRLHSASNVYVAGSSVFPTPGNDMPTLTIVALALRLADHLRARLEPPHALT